ncbi:MAG: SOS response-associated peptidase family protein [Ectothiorhodospiraceae bacterium]|nr:SOS response-associated peptidase family protein [Ectothiorhodospiraceae bacterium]
MSKPCAVAFFQSFLIQRQRAGKLIHERMPVIIDPEYYAAWLDLTNQNIDMLTVPLKPYPAASLKV